MKITWVLVPNSSGPNGPMNQREDYHEAMHTPQRQHTTRLFFGSSATACEGWPEDRHHSARSRAAFFCVLWFASEDHNAPTHGDDDAYSGMTSKTGLSEWSRRKQ